MIGILIITHSNLGQGLIDAGSLILGEIPRCKAMGLMPGMHFDTFVNDIAEEIEREKTDEGTLVMVDLFGGTPGNAATMAKRFIEEDTKYVIVSGANLPMLLEAHVNRESMSLEELKEHVISIGNSSSMDVMKKLGL